MKGPSSPFDNFSIAVLVGTIVLFGIVQVGQWKIAAYTIPILFTLLSLAALYIFGTGDTVVMEYALAVILAAVFLGKIETIIISAVIAVSAVIISYIKSKTDANIDVTFEIVANGVFFSMMAFILGMLTDHFQRSLKKNSELIQKTEEELRAKIKAEKDLRAKNDELEIIIKATVDRENKMVELKKALQEAGQ